MDHTLIGKKVKLKVSTTSRVYENLSLEPIVSTHYELDDPVMETLILEILLEFLRQVRWVQWSLNHLGLMST